MHCPVLQARAPTRVPAGHVGKLSSVTTVSRLARVGALQRRGHVRTASAAAPDVQNSSGGVAEAVVVAAPAPLELTPAERAARRSFILKDTADFLKSDLRKAFETGDITANRYAENMVFEDPLTRFGNREGYIFNIKALRFLFNITFDLHAIDVTAEDEITARWSMSMELWALPWKPEFICSGRAVYKVDPDTGKILSHTDYWDALKRNQFLSLEGITHVIKQVTQVQLTPNIETPKYTVLQRLDEYEIRRYEPYVVAQTAMGPGAGPASGAGFNELAGYIFGGNDANVSMEMTTPVLTAVEPTQSSVTMKFVMENRFANNPAALPLPKDSRIITLREAPRFVAAIRFAGWPLDYEVVDAERTLRECLLRDGVEAAPGYQLARYNEPTVPPMLRRNEVLISLPSFVWPPPPPPAAALP